MNNVVYFLSLLFFIGCACDSAKSNNNIPDASTNGDRDTLEIFDLSNTVDTSNTPDSSNLDTSNIPDSYEQGDNDPAKECSSNEKVLNLNWQVKNMVKLK